MKFLSNITKFVFNILTILYPTKDISLQKQNKVKLAIWPVIFPPNYILSP